MMPSRARTLVAVAYVVGAFAALVEMTGGSWDIQFHIARQILQDEFWTVPHAVLYGGAGLLFLAVGTGLLVGARRGFFDSLMTGLWLALGGVTLQFAAGALDEWWHGAFGVDDALSPPHVLLIAGMVIAAVGLVVGLTRLSRDVEVRGSLPRALLMLVPLALASAFTALYFALWGMAWVFTYPGFVGEPFLPHLWQRSVVATVFAALVPLVVVLAARTSPYRGTATATLGLATFSFYAVAALLGALPTDPLLLLVGIGTFLIPGVLADGLLRRERSPAGLLATTAAVGLVGGLFLALFQDGPVLAMTGGLSGNPVWHLVLYLGGGLTGGLLGLPLAQHLIRPTAGPRRRAETPA